jgi:dolichol-phosphate mannosyltransferase
VETPTDHPFISFATPAHNEIAALPELYRRIKQTMTKIGATWEIVVVDDGSTDGTREYLRDLAGRDRRVKVALLSRNFGHTPAYLAALHHSSGEWIVLMDADLQDEPEVVSRMLAATNDGAEVVYAIKSSRPEGFLMRLAFSLYYRVAGRMSSVPQPKHAGPFCLMSRRVVDQIIALPERNIFFPGVRAYVGYRQMGIPVERPPRVGGSSRIPLRVRISGALDGLLAFSTAPLRIAAWLGVIVASLTGVIELFFIGFKLFADVTVPGFTALITLILFLGGVQLLTVGVIGEYLGRVYDEVKRRPRYLVEERLNIEADVPGLDLSDGMLVSEMESRAGATTP